MPDSTPPAPSASDRNVEAVILKHRQRAARGLEKYGVTTERTDLTTREWFQHCQDELMDAAVYLEVLMGRLESAARPAPGTTSEQVEVLAREYYMKTGRIASGDGMVEWLAGFVSFVRERERAGKGDRNSEPSGLTKSPERVGPAASQGQEGDPASTAGSAPRVVAAPGDEAAREAIKSALSNNGGPIDAESTVDGVDYVMVRLVDFKALEAALARVPRPADTRERESEAGKVLREIEWGYFPGGRCPCCNKRPHLLGCRLTAVLNKEKPRADAR